MPQSPQRPTYASPVLRSPSPASSIGTSYEPDQTSPSDTELEISQQAFEQKWQERLGLGMPTQAEVQASEDPLLQTPNNAAEEKAMYDCILPSLRQKLRELEENEISDQVLLRGSKIGLEQQPTSDNITTLMQTMMGKAVTSRNNIADGPWNYHGLHDNNTSNLNASTMQKANAKGKARSRKGTRDAC